MNNWGQDVKPGMGTHHEHTYTSNTTYCLYVNNYEHSDSVKLCGYIQQIIFRQNLFFRNKFIKKIKIIRHNDLETYATQKWVL
jgi:hypothetical protein